MQTGGPRRETAARTPFHRPECHPLYRRWKRTGCGRGAKNFGASKVFGPPPLTPPLHKGGKGMVGVAATALRTRDKDRTAAPFLNPSALPILSLNEMARLRPLILRFRVRTHGTQSRKITMRTTVPTRATTRPGTRRSLR